MSRKRNFERTDHREEEERPCEPDGSNPHGAGCVLSSLTQLPSSRQYQLCAHCWKLQVPAHPQAVAENALRAEAADHQLEFHPTVGSIHVANAVMTEFLGV
jgi:hypothetical protein